ncbi:MAG: hypothetical protein WEB78_09790 [Ilumatobacteraceae bacterium]
MTTGSCELTARLAAGGIHATAGALLIAIGAGLHADRPGRRGSGRGFSFGLPLIASTVAVVLIHG